MGTADGWRGAGGCQGAAGGRVRQVGCEVAVQGAGRDTARLRPATGSAVPEDVPAMTWGWVESFIPAFRSAGVLPAGVGWLAGLTNRLTARHFLPGGAARGPVLLAVPFRQAEAGVRPDA